MAIRKKINRRHAKRWAYSHTAFVLHLAMAEGWPYFEGFDPDTAEKLEKALLEVKATLIKRGLLENDPEIWKDKKGSIDVLV